MSKFTNANTQVVVSVSDEKDTRFVAGWEPYRETIPAPTSKKASTSKKSDS